MELWDWIRDDAMRLMAEGRDALPRALYTFQRDFAMVPNAEVEAALDNGIASAIEEQEPRWHAMFLHLSVMYYGIGSGNLKRVLDVAMDLVLELNTLGPHLPLLRQQAFLDLASAYLGIDPLGYEDQIRGILEAPERDDEPVTVGEPDRPNGNDRDMLFMGRTAVLMHLETLRGDLDAATARWDALIAAGLQPIPGVRTLHARIKQRRGQLDDALAEYKRCVRQFEEDEETTPMALTCHAWLVELCVAMDELDLAASFARRVDYLHERFKNGVRTAEWHWVHALLLRAKGECAEAFERLIEANTLLTELHHLRQATRAAVEAAATALQLPEASRKMSWAIARSMAERSNARLRKRDYTAMIADLDENAP